jgi:cyclic peptide transporter
MNIITLFQIRSKSFYFLFVLLGLVRSVTSIGILMLINMALTGRSIGLFGESNINYLAYIILIAVSFICSALFQNYMVKFNNDLMFNLEISLIQKVRHAAYSSFEKMGYQRIYAALGDARQLGRLPEVFITLVNSVITIICSMAYLFWVSPAGGFTVVVLMCILLGFYMYRDRRIARDMNKIRDLQDNYYDYLRELLVGFKQIRISGFRNKVLFNKFILLNRERSRDLSVRTSRSYLINELTGTYSWYILLGVIIFALPALIKIDMLQIAAFITSVLFMMAPISQLVMFFPVFNTFKISIERIEKINKQLEEDARNTHVTEFSITQFNSIRFENLFYQYQEDDQNTFSVELAEFTIRKGEVIFIVGGNGSGKTTFINLLVGLYKPLSGKVFIDEKEVTWQEFHAFSNSMAVVFTDHHMFFDNYDEHDLSDQNEQVKYMRKLVNLDNILKLDADGNKADVRLSKGQQKRLALMLALMENKPILVLDEWAAEQDPKNRKYFYTELLSILKDMGKTVVAISHDEDFYHIADRVVRFDFGKIVSDHKLTQTIFVNSVTDI